MVSRRWVPGAVRPWSAVLRRIVATGLTAAAALTVITGGMSASAASAAPPRCPVPATSSPAESAAAVIVSPCADGAAPAGVRWQ